ncbi:hypothetical protein CEXT_645761 [Caerostris extrusa]|uniref:Uncharacterized protein n=1 Tax=Caerostris extrusa TaxID=172846 RepID=A0AAV4Y9C6_CAEEX|nr:hypothetical protein CEXT_645761 [Caerostris extrusa]
MSSFPGLNAISICAADLHCKALSLFKELSQPAPIITIIPTSSKSIMIIILYSNFPPHNFIMEAISLSLKMLQLALPWRTFFFANLLQKTKEVFCCAYEECEMMHLLHQKF